MACARTIMFRVSTGSTTKKHLTKKIMENNYGYSYIVRITIATNNLTLIIRNRKIVPRTIIETIARERIIKFINDMYSQNKHYRTQTSENFFNKTIKQSDFQIEDINDAEVYDLNLQFTQHDKIINRENDDNNKRHIEIRQSKINKNENDFVL